MTIAEPEIEEANEWRTAQRQFDEAAELIGLEPELRDILREVQREFTCHFPVEMEDGRIEVFDGTGHFVHIEKPREVADVVLEFLGQP